MKLLTKTTVYFLLIMLPFFTAGAFYLFHKFNKEIRHEIDEELVNDKLQWMRYLDTASVNSPVYGISTPEFNLIPTTEAPQHKHKLKGVTIYQEPEDAYAPFRQLTQVITVHNRNYKLILRKSTIEKDDLRENIIKVMLLAVCGLLIFVLVSNWLISKRVWKPFYQSLDRIRHLQLNRMEAQQFPRTRTHEFNELNAALNNMAARIHTDYVNMKELTEDAAHEMQTPLAIAQSKLELLLQEDTLSEEQLKAIAQSSDELQRLSRLNHSLLLLARIENQQYPVKELTDLSAVAEKYLQLFEELIKEKQLSVRTAITAPSLWPLHPALADMLMSNLLGNAIKYNHADGAITINLTENTLTISNTSTLQEIPASSLFQRFKKHAPEHSHANGLGLAIVKKIVESNELDIHYHYQDNTHSFTVKQFK